MISRTCIFFLFLVYCPLFCQINLDWGIDYDRIYLDPVHKWNMSFCISDNEVDSEGFFLFGGDESGGCLDILNVSAGIKSEKISMGPVDWGPVYRNLFGLPVEDKRYGESYGVVKSLSFNRSAAFFRTDGFKWGFLHSGKMDAVSLDLISDWFSLYSLLGTCPSGKTASNDWIREFPAYPGCLLHNCILLNPVMSGAFSLQAGLMTSRGPGVPFQYGYTGSFIFSQGPFSIFQDILMFTPGYITPERKQVSDINISSKVVADYPCWDWIAEGECDISDECCLFKESMSVRHRLGSCRYFSIGINAEHDDIFLQSGVDVSLQGKSCYIRYNLDKQFIDEEYQSQSLETGFSLGLWKLKAEMECNTDSREAYSFSLSLSRKGARITHEESVSINDWTVPRRYGEVPGLIHSFRLDGSYRTGLYN